MLSPISSMKIEWATLSIKGIGFSYSKNLSVERTRKGNASRLPPADRRTRKRAVSIFRTLIKDTDYLGDKQSEDLFLWDSGRLRAGCDAYRLLDALGSGVRGHSRNGNRRVSAWLTVRRRRVRMESASVCWDSGCDYRTICGR